MKLNLSDVFQGRKNMLVALGLSVAVLLVLETIIFLVLAASSGEQSRIEVRDRAGKIIYDVAGTTLSHINFSYFERKYGDLSNYDVQIKTLDKPFPVRAWVSASVGVPLALMLLISYLVKVYLTLLQGEQRPDEGNYPTIYEKTHPFVAWSLFVSGSSIFLMGGVIAGLALMFWMVPNFLRELVGLGTAAVRDGGSLVAGSALFVAGFVLWVVYLRYRLSRRMMDYQYRLEKQRLEQQLRGQAQLTPDLRDTTLPTRDQR
ncbi:MAG: hypothetical protein AB9873_11690 [Syntrophobacteraceae bacterium]